MVYQGPNRGGREVEGRGGEGVLPFLGFRWVPMMKQGKSLGSDDKTGYKPGQGIGVFAFLKNSLKKGNPLCPDPVCTLFSPGSHRVQTGSSFSGFRFL